MPDFRVRPKVQFLDRVVLSNSPKITIWGPLYVAQGVRLTVGVASGITTGLLGSALVGGILCRGELFSGIGRKTRRHPTHLAGHPSVSE
jgi:hypothetical protein